MGRRRLGERGSLDNTVRADAWFLGSSRTGVAKFEGNGRENHFERSEKAFRTAVSSRSNRAKMRILHYAEYGRVINFTDASPMPIFFIGLQRVSGDIIASLRDGFSPITSSEAKIS